MFADNCKTIESGQVPRHCPLHPLKCFLYRDFRLPAVSLVRLGLSLGERNSPDATKQRYDCRRHSKRAAMSLHGISSNASHRIQPCCPSWVSTPNQYGVEITIK